MTNQQRIEELETALENLLENSEVFIEDEIATASFNEAFLFAQQVLYDEGYEYDSEDQG